VQHIGIVIDTITNNEINRLMFNTLNDLSKRHPVYLFANYTHSLPIKNQFCILQQLHALNHNGILIGTSLLNSQIVINSLVAKEKYYYMWEPEWLKFNELRFSQLDKIINNPELNLITRTQEHFNLMQSLFKIPLGIVKNWNIDDMEEIICQTSLV
jgi:hypothetical protein